MMSFKLRPRLVLRVVVKMQLEGYQVADIAVSLVSE